MNLWFTVLSFFKVFTANSESCFGTMENIRDVVAVSSHRSGIQKMMDLYSDYYYPESEANDFAKFSANLQMNCSQSCSYEQCVREMQKSLTQTIAIIGEDCAEPKSRTEAQKNGDFSTVQMLVLKNLEGGQVKSYGASLANFVGNCRTIVTNAHNLYLNPDDDRSPLGDRFAFLLPQVEGVSQPHIFDVNQVDIVFSEAVTNFRRFRSSRVPTTSDDYAIITLKNPVPDCSFYSLPDAPTTDVDLPVDHPSLRFVAIRRDSNWREVNNLGRYNLFSYVGQKANCGGFKTPKTPGWRSEDQTEFGVVYNDFSLISGNSGGPLVLGNQFIGMHVGVKYDPSVKREDDDNFRDLPFEAQEDGRSALNRTVLLQGRFYDNLREVLKKQAEAEVVQGSNQDGSTPL